MKMITRQQYVEVLEDAKKRILESYQPQEEGTGHFNTASFVVSELIFEMNKGNSSEFVL
jgi:predicted 3-demethylubiquinone-9 3-methyltransferase (glyoxalase superfamily)